MVFAKLEKIYVGQCLYDYHLRKSQIKGLMEPGNWPVYVKEIDLERRRALCSWNGNPARWYSEDMIKKLRLERKPIKKRAWEAY